MVPMQPEMHNHVQSNTKPVLLNHSQARRWKLPNTRYAWMQQPMRERSTAASHIASESVWAFGGFMRATSAWSGVKKNVVTMGIRVFCS